MKSVCRPPPLTSESITVPHWSQIPKAWANYGKVPVDKVQLIPPSPAHHVPSLVGPHYTLTACFLNPTLGSNTSFPFACCGMMDSRILQEPPHAQFGGSLGGMVHGFPYHLSHHHVYELAGHQLQSATAVPFSIDGLLNGSCTASVVSSNSLLSAGCGMNGDNQYKLTGKTILLHDFTSFYYTLAECMLCADKQQRRDAFYMEQSGCFPVATPRPSGAEAASRNDSIITIQPFNTHSRNQCMLCADKRQRHDAFLCSKVDASPLHRDRLVLKLRAGTMLLYSILSQNTHMHPSLTGY